MNSHALTELLPGSHIYAANNVLGTEFCQSTIARFESATDEQYQGRVGQTEVENPEIKRSTDLVVSGKAHWNDVDRTLFSSLGAALNVLRQENAFFRGRFKDYGYALQRTEPGEYFHWHVDSGSHSFADRQLVAIWYLNDVPGPGGETEFRHQNIRVKPEQGKLLLFPPFWTHEHRGVTLEKGVKYIATTWVLFA
ncbi:MAG: 2OG-Fe(II) oxygenase [Gammaproteobacteria bacterium]|nr:2OG-Fe(II) oxygenase [Gammaproteobacteria bacterium]